MNRLGLSPALRGDKSPLIVAHVYELMDRRLRFDHRWGEKGHMFYPPRLMWPFIEQAFVELEE